ncbi:MAG: hypothetical protein JWO67_1418 [Streptosporangiaceae bacterium]|nr:hypothetical protein [Streptosporangiaceae bacterium]
MAAVPGGTTEATVTRTLGTGAARTAGTVVSTTLAALAAITRRAAEPAVAGTVISAALAALATLAAVPGGTTEATVTRTLGTGAARTTGTVVPAALAALAPITRRAAEPAVT